MDEIETVEAVNDIAPTSPAPKKLPKELVMHLENLSLKTQNVQLQLQLMQQQLGAAMEAKGRLQTEMEELRQKVLMEHGVDVAAVQVAADGTVIPARNMTRM